MVFSNIVKELKKDGHDVFVITISAKPEKRRPVISEMDDIRIFRFYPRNIFSFVDINSQPFWKRMIWHVLDIFNFHSYRQVRKILKQEKPELVLTHNLKGLGYLTILAIKSLHLKNIHTLHDVQLVNPSGLIMKDQVPAWWWVIFAQITKLLIDSPEIVVSPSKWLMDFYKKYGFFKNSKEVILPNPIIVEQENYKKVFTDEFTNYLFLGQLEMHKGILLLLDVFADFAREHKCRLYVVGSGRLANILAEKYKGQDWIEFVGYVPANQLSQKVFKKIHYTIVPSLCCENSPSVIYDSFNFGTPVIASAIGGVPELVQEGVNGYLFEPGNKISLLNKLNLCQQNMDKFTQMSENAKIRAKEWDIKNYIYKLLQL